MTGRQQLHQLLTEALPEWVIVSDARKLDTVRKPGAVVLWTERLTRPAKLGLDYIEATLHLWVLTATDKPELLEDDLDSLLLDVLTAIEPHDAFGWVEAERGVLDEKFQGWRIPVTCLTKITD